MNPATLWRAWTWDLPVLLALVLTTEVYGFGVYGLWRRAGIGHGVRRWQVGAYAGAVLALVVALISPLDALSGVLFSAHMVQHMILILVAAPLLAFSNMPVAVLWALPRSLRHRIGQWWHRAALRQGWRGLDRPISAWLVFAGALWLWHIPAFYQAALASDFIHGLEHSIFLGASALYWWVLVRPGRQHFRHITFGISVLSLFTTALHSSILGALLTFASQPWYPAYANSVATWNLTALQDQQLAGLVMWVPVGALYTVLGAIFFTLWLLAVEARTEQHSRIQGQAMTD